MNATVNGAARELPEGTTLGALLRKLGVEGVAIAIAVNERVVPRATFEAHRLSEGDAVEIIRAAAGG